MIIKNLNYFQEADINKDDGSPNILKIDFCGDYLLIETGRFTLNLEDVEVLKRLLEREMPENEAV